MGRIPERCSPNARCREGNPNYPLHSTLMGMSEHQVKGFFIASPGSSFFNVNHTPLYFEQSFIKSACESFSLNLKL